MSIQRGELYDPFKHLRGDKLDKELKQRHLELCGVQLINSIKSL